MKEAFKDWGELHHAYIVKGSSSGDVWAVLESQLGFVREANPDAYQIELESFGIDEARELSLWAIKKSFGERKIAVIGAKSVTSEAQNALLKLFEEPSPNTYFFLTLPSLGFILPTLLSRVQVISEDGKIEISKDVNIFLKADIKERLKMVNSILKNKDKEKAVSLIRDIAKNLDTNKVPKETIESVLYAEMAIRGRAPSMKMILELLALTV